MEKKLKLGLVTYCIGNQGSVLQCYATQQYLAEKGFDCCLFTRRESGVARILQSLEYRVGAYWKLLKSPQYWSVYQECSYPKRGNTPMTQESIDVMKQFVDECVCTERRSWAELQRLARSDNYMAFFSGSDQIWSGLWFLTNRMWFLRFCPKDKRVAWMPSFGSDTVAEYNKSIYKRYISEYQFLSVREAMGQSIIQELTGRQVPILPDPVYLLSAKQWRSILVDTAQESKYILMFFISKPNPLAVEYALRKAALCDAQVVWLDYNHGGDGVFVAGGPREFISYIDGAELVLTDSFHASLFSIILSTPFYVYQRTDENGSKQIGRLHNLLEKFCMQNRLAENGSIIETDDWDDDVVQNVLDGEKKKTDAFFKEIVDFYLGEKK